jgi:hypothetical protein
MNRGDPGDEDDISIIPTVLPGGTRDFLILRQETADNWRLIPPVELLSLNRVARTIARIQESRPDLGHNLALARLLIWNLKFRGSGRHFAAEPWTEEDLRGTALPADVRTDLACELSAEQSREYLEITTGQQRLAGATSELFWRAVVDLPRLPPTFDDPDLGRFAKTLYLHLVPHEDGMVDVSPSEVAAKVNACWNSEFASLGLNAQARDLRKVFRRLLSLTVQWAGQLVGAAAEGVVLAKKAAGNRPLSDREKRLLELRYGACPALGGVSVGFLVDCGPILVDLITEYAYVVAAGTDAEIREAEENLRRFAYLVAEYRTRRKSARADERKDKRERRADRMPSGYREEIKDHHADPSSPNPVEVVQSHEELEALRSILTKLKPRDAKRIRAFIDCGGDRRAAAELLGVDLTKYSRQLRQTVFPALRRLRRQELEEGE